MRFMASTVSPSSQWSAVMRSRKFCESPIACLICVHCSLLSVRLVAVEVGGGGRGWGRDVDCWRCPAEEGEGREEGEREGGRGGGGGREKGGREGGRGGGGRSIE